MGLWSEIKSESGLWSGLGLWSVVKSESGLWSGPGLWSGERERVLVKIGVIGKVRVRVVVRDKKSRSELW